MLLYRCFCRDGIARVKGLKTVKAGELVKFQNKTLGMAFKFRNIVCLVLLSLEVIVT